MMFVWLGVALIVDAVDGPLARARRRQDGPAALQRRAARPDRRLSHLCRRSRLRARSMPISCPEPFRLPAGRGHPAVEPVPRRRPQQQDRGWLFRRLPGDLERRAALSVRLPASRPMSRSSSSCCSSTLTFVPILSVHPFRVARLRPLTCACHVGVDRCRRVAVANPFPSPLWVQVLLVADGCLFRRV